jgi:hypothetical protein
MRQKDAPSATNGRRCYPCPIKITLEERALLKRRADRRRTSVAAIIRAEGIDQAVADERSLVAEELLRDPEP